MELSLSSLLKNFFQIISTGLNDIGGLHPFIVHFPIALLFIAPLFVLTGIVFSKSAKSLFLSSLILMIAGSLFLILATLSGEAASETLQISNAALETLETHDELAETSRLIFIVLTITFAAYFFLADTLLKKMNKTFHLGFLILFLSAYCFGILILSSTAHQGGKLVHHHGIQSKLFSQ